MKINYELNNSTYKKVELFSYKIIKIIKNFVTKLSFYEFVEYKCFLIMNKYKF